MAAYRAAVVTLALLALALTMAPGASAASNGLAWDSVTKVSMGTDAASLTPGNFSQDYAQAAAVGPPPEAKGGLMGKVGQAMGMGKRMQALMQNGFAEKHYIAGSKERTDQVADQTATIVDCAARTVTTLNLAHKTYKIESMDQPSAPASQGSSSSKPDTQTRDDIKHLSIVIANKALGSKTVDGQPTDGFQSEVSFTETRTNGETQSQNGDLVGYYSSYANPATSCSWFGKRPDAHGAQNSAPNFSAMTAGFTRLSRALMNAGGDSRVSINQSGPTLPRSKLALFEAATFGGGPSGGGTFLTERGNVRSISAADPAFSIPSDFTREQ